MSGARTVLYCTESQAASTWYRHYVPGVELQRRGYDVTLVGMATPREVADCDVFVTRFWVRQATYRLMLQAKQDGKHCVLDMDDDIWALHPENPAYEVFSKPESADYAREIVRTVDTVTVTTDYLADLVRPLNPNVHVIRNMLPAEHWPSTPKSLNHPEPIVIGWAGSSSHGPDLRLLHGVVESVLSACPDVRFAFSETLGYEVPDSDRVDVLPAVPIEEYASMVSRFDIGLAPLVDTRFNRAKSDLKVIEYGMCGIPAVASKVVPYEGTIRHGENGLLAASPKDWIKCIRRLVDDADLRERMGKAARATAERRTIERHIDRWVRAFKLE